MSDWITEETESVLVNCIGRAGVVRIAHDDVQMLPDRFPFDLGRIVWGDDVEAVRCLDLASQAAGFADSVRKFVCCYLDEHEIRLPQVLWVMPDRARHSYAMPPSDFWRCANDLLSLPQHTYVTDPEMSWCFAYHFEEYMCIGKSRD